VSCLFDTAATGKTPALKPGALPGFGPPLTVSGRHRPSKHQFGADSNGPEAQVTVFSHVSLFGTAPARSSAASIAIGGAG